jgi:bacteriocin biosynthesis cyclodehydratase domain-containing protein
MPVPERPLLAPWYRLSGTDDRLLLEHGQAVVALEGGAVRAFLPALLPLLDGTRSRDDLVRRLGAAARPAVDLALETLAAHDLLVEGPDAAPEVRGPAHAAAAAFGITPSAAAERLGSAAVGIAGSSATAADIVRLLRLSGLGDVRRVSWRRGARVDLAIVAPAGDEASMLEKWNRAAQESGTRWLPVRPYDGRFGAVGPLVVPGESCCWECVTLRRAANLEYGDDLHDLESAPTAAPVDAGLQALVVALVAHLAVRWVVGADTTLPGVLYAVEARPALAVSEHTVLRVPRCPVCSDVERLSPRMPWHGAEEGAKAA